MSKNKIILMVLYAVIMFSAIAFQIDTWMFLALFIAAPLGVYLFVKKIFPKQDNQSE